jgi:TRAP-type mannitol/chloroaromatic compound transport system permease large subunit
MVCKSHLRKKQNASFDIIWFGVIFCMNMHIAYLWRSLVPSAFYIKTVTPPQRTLFVVISAEGAKTMMLSEM